tara:strand:- start:2609 stop:3958 length:1350 start_codon:yes stop_codon:yes gene_type:complete
MKSKILIIDDEKDICFLISEILKDENYITNSVNNSKDALELNSKFNPDLIILDVWLGNSDLDGIGLLKEFKKNNPLVPVIIISGHGTVDMAVNAIKNGAYDFLEKPFNSEKLIVLSRRAIENANLIKENNLLKEITDSNSKIIGNSNFILELNKNLEKISISNARVLISGPIGSGKKLIAQQIHKISKRNNSLANIIDFSVLSSNQYNELFSDDINNLNKNIFLNSNNGTLIFQNIDMASLIYQKKILYYLESPEFFSKINVKFNIKIISLTSKNLNEEIIKGNFLKDLFYRINVIPIKIPSIKDRSQDIIPICNYYLDKFNRNKKFKFFLSKKTILKLESYNWPGNIRQISNYMERLVILNQNKNTDKDFELLDLIDDIGEFDYTSPKTDVKIELNIKDAREKFEREYFLSQIKRFNGNIIKISDFTGMERTALYRKLKSLNIDLNKI